MSSEKSLIDPGPVANPAKNPHRVGAPNHHQHNGSGEKPMVGIIRTSGHALDATTATFVRERLNGQTHRFMTATHAGLTVHVADLADLVTEIITEYTSHVTAERDALAEDLAWELNATRTEVA